MTATIVPGWDDPEALAVRKILNRSKRLERLIEMEAPNVVVAQERWLLRTAMDEWVALEGEERQP